MASVNTSYPSTCEPDPSYCAGEDVFSVEVEADSTGSIVTPATGDVQFVFDAPVVDTNGGVDPYQFTQFTLVTTENGQTACPISWQACHRVAGDRHPVELRAVVERPAGFVGPDAHAPGRLQRVGL